MTSNCSISLIQSDGNYGKTNLILDDEASLIIGEQILINECSANNNVPTDAYAVYFSDDGTCDPSDDNCFAPLIECDIDGSRRWLKIIINEGGNFCSKGEDETAWKLSLKIAHETDGQGIFHPAQGTLTLSVLNSSKPHNLYTGEPVEHWFETKSPYQDVLKDFASSTIGTNGP